MKSWVLFLIAGGLCIGPVVSNVYALDSIEQRTQEVSDKLDAQARQEPQRVEERLVREYNVTGAQIENLRGQGLGFGDINIVFGLAEQMSGGVSDQNIKTVVSTKQSQPEQSWGSIAKTLNLDLQPVADKLSGLDDPKQQMDVGQQGSTRENLDRTKTEEAGGLSGSGSSGSSY